MHRIALRLRVELGWHSFVNRTQAFALNRRVPRRCLGLPVLDAGAGPGNLALLLALRGAKVVDLDPDAVRLGLLTSRLNRWRDTCDVGVVVASGVRLPFHDGTFGLVVCNSVLEHVVEDRTMIEEFGRVLAADGVLAMTLPSASLRFGDRYSGFWHWVLSWPPWLKRLLLEPGLARTDSIHDAQQCVEDRFLHLRRYTAESVRRVLLDSNLEVVECSYYLTRLGAFWHDVIVAFDMPPWHAITYLGHLLNCVDRALPRSASAADDGKGFTMIAVRSD